MKRERVRDTGTGSGAASAAGDANRAGVSSARGTTTPVPLSAHCQADRLCALMGGGIAESHTALKSPKNCWMASRTCSLIHALTSSEGGLQLAHVLADLCCCLPYHNQPGGHQVMSPWSSDLHFLVPTSHVIKPRLLEGEPGAGCNCGTCHNSGSPNILL